MIDSLLIGLSTALTPANLMFCVIGVLLGTLTGVLPGIGPMAGVALSLPFIHSMADPAGSLMALAGIYYGAQYGGSTSAILFKIPGESSSIVTALDGYEMARKGRAGSAITIAALASFFAGCVSALIVFISSKEIAELSLMIGPADFSWLMLLGLLMSIVISKENVVASSAMVCIGILLSTIGTDSTTGVVRFAFENVYLTDGLNFILIVVGVIGLSELVYKVIFDNETHQTTQTKLDLYPSKQELKDSVAPTVRGTFVGSLLGMIPGAGSLIGPFVSYTIEKTFSKNRKEIGSGRIEGVAAPEAANNAAAQTSFIPLFSLGVPFTPIIALIMGTLILNTKYPGPNFIALYPEIFYGFVISMVIGNILLLMINLPMIRVWLWVLSIPKKILYPVIFFASFVGIYFINESIYDTALLIPLIIAGVIFRYLKCDAIPLVMGFVCGRLFEEYFRRSMIISGGDPMIFFNSPVLYVTIISIVVYTLAKKFLK